MITKIKKDFISEEIFTRELKRMLVESSDSSKVRQVAWGIVDGHDDHSKIGAIYTWVKDNVIYTPDPIGPEGEIELFTSPIYQIEKYFNGEQMREDCDGIALMVASLARSVGIPARIILIDVAGNGIDHAVAELYSNKLHTWIMIDASSKFPPGWHENSFRRVEI